MIGRILIARQASAIVLVAAAIAIEAWLIGVMTPRDRALVGLLALFPIASNVTLFATLLDSNRKSAAILVAASSAVALVLVLATVTALGDVMPGG